MGVSKAGFQQFVNNELPIGVAGDFASTNPRASIVAGPGQFVAPAAGTKVGGFAWFDPTTGLASNYYKSTGFLGFVHRENNGLITAFLGVATLFVVPGNMVTGMSYGDYLTLFASGANVGQIVYADPVTGAATAGAPGNAGTTAVTASVSALGVLTVTAVTGTLAVGQLVLLAGLPEGSYIASLGSGTGGAGTYNLANANGAAYAVIASTTGGSTLGPQETIYTVGSTVDPGFSATASIAPEATGLFGVMTVSAVASGSVAVGDFISSSVAGLPTNVQITQQLTGNAGSTGTYLISWNGTLGSGTVTGLQGRIGVITSLPQ